MGLLNLLELAFSGDQSEEMYVKTRMPEHGRGLFSWFEKGGHSYVCGDATRMAKYRKALHDVVADRGGLTRRPATEYVNALKEKSGTSATCTEAPRACVSAPTLRAGYVPHAPVVVRQPGLVADTEVVISLNLGLAESRVTSMLFDRPPSTEVTGRFSGRGSRELDRRAKEGLPLVPWFDFDVTVLVEIDIDRLT